eukprot:scaffold106849_cov23-Tisochrysis_lutea.AAC.2
MDEVGCNELSEVKKGFKLKGGQELWRQPGSFTRLNEMVHAPVQRATLTQGVYRVAMIGHAIAMAAAGNVVGLRRLLGRYRQLHKAVRGRLEGRLKHEVERAQRLQSIKCAEGASMQRCPNAEVPQLRGAPMQRCTNAEVPQCRGASMQRCPMQGTSSMQSLPLHHDCILIASCLLYMQDKLDAKEAELQEQQQQLDLATT